MAFVIGLLSTFAVGWGVADAVVASGLSDYGGDVSQYLGLLEGSSAFSFSPLGGEDDSDEDKEQRARAAMTTSRKAAAASGGDFGGDYGNYLRLLEKDSALGYNPQTDPISDNQDLQSDVFGGGMSGKFWDAFKGRTSYSDDDDLGVDAAEELQAMDEEQILEEDLRQAGEEDQPEDRYNRKPKVDDDNTNKSTTKKKDSTVIIALTSDKSKLNKIYSKVKSAQDQAELVDILDALDAIENEEDPGKGERMVQTWSEDRGGEGKRLVQAVRELRKSSEDQSEKESQTRSADVLSRLEEFIKAFDRNVPDPITTSKGLSMSFRNLTLYGVSRLRVCGGGVRENLLTSASWKASLCLPSLSVSLDSVTGPGVPFKGRVKAFYAQPKLHVSFQDDSDSIHFVSVHAEAGNESGAPKFVPVYDSSIPLNPWSKVSMSGYMVSRVKRILPSMLDKTLLKLLHVVERMNLD